MDEHTDAEMNFELSPELRMLKAQVRRFVDTEMIPVEMRSRRGEGMDPEIKAHLEEKAKALGLSGYDVPQEYGGQGLGLLAKAVVWSELGRTIALPSRNVEIFGPNVSPLLYLMNPEQKERYLRPTLRGELRWCFAQTEPEAGGDPARMRAQAVRDGDDYIINGHKRFITAAGTADYAQVIAVTDREKAAHGGISTFVVDMKAPGVKLLRQQKLVIDDRPWEVLFDHVRVPARDLIGREGDGFRLAQTWLSIGRIRHGARGIGVIERCLEMGARYAEQRVTFGAPLAERQSVQFALADSYTDLHQLRLMTYDAALKYDAGRDIRVEAYMAKIFGDAQSFVAADRCLTIHGGIGLTTDLPIEKFWRDQRSMMITEGPNEILKMALARSVFKEYGGGRAERSA
jgi:acyl-CoA dehydrogenase